MTPAAPASTFVTSVAGAGAFAPLFLAGTGDVAPDWHLGRPEGWAG